MSLAFLSKKSWHTANLRNVEKVWIAEQKHAAEEKKVAELRKNIEQERQLQELRQLQADQGNKSAAIERVDWMYEGPSAAREKTAEEFLLGKEYKGEDEKTAVEEVDLSATTKYGSLALTKSALPANDAFQRLHEDPMMLIRKRQQAAREEVLKNPVKMKRIQEEVDRLKQMKKAKKDRKKEKKRARKDEKRRLRKKRKLRGDSEDSEDGVDKKMDSCFERNHSTVHRGNDRASEKERLRQRSSGRYDDEGSGREDTRRDRSSRQDASQAHENDSVGVHRHGHSRTDAESRRKPVDREGKYGLINKTDAVKSKNVDKTSLGPSVQHLAKAREAKRLEEEERQRKLGEPSGKEARKLTEEEKRQRVQQMVDDAKQRDEYIKKRATLKKDELDKLEQNATSSNPEFLRKVRSDAYLDSESSMSDRLRRNAHYIQRKADASNFLTK
ncbi:unnamed protein product [Hyaloperonospora brassicae]|uniref:CBF1-interacting co-repressor CIR N-terminal domain-containing protein n=1 Tax=Hyaloperonospora brassicae TaxID=162125 RepID=A0AAV0U7T7_HYABA|nr:unnamed protein product [Hyaloperonospora brassicae]